MGEAAEMALDQPYEGASGWVRWSDCAICRTPASGASTTGPVSRRRGGFSSIPQRSPQRTRSGSSLPPQKFRSGSAAVPQRFRSGTALPPQRFCSGSTAGSSGARHANSDSQITKKKNLSRTTESSRTTGTLCDLTEELPCVLRCSLLVYWAPARPAPPPQRLLRCQTHPSRPSLQ